MSASLEGQDPQEDPRAAALPVLADCDSESGLAGVFVLVMPR
ncbi:hypothetical protein O1L60_28815 [Streptomyces diastatochromogenes]|nr:hypothetical protein [Streptomyces diastatochromogenes]